MSVTRVERASWAELRRLAGAIAARPAWLRLVYIGLFLALWEIGARLDNDALFVSPPSHVLRALAIVLADRGVILALAAAFAEVLAGFVLSVIIGVAVGLAIGLSRYAYYGLYRVILVIYGIPKVTIFPIILLAFGIGPAGKIAFGFVHGVFPITVAVVAGLRGQDPALRAAAKAMGAKPRHYFRWVIFPHMAPSLFAAMRIAMSGVLLGVLLAELYVSYLGIGFYTTQYSQNFEPARLFALVGVLAAMAIALNEILRRVEIHFTAWRIAANR